jgi:hypothetical protein
MDFQSVKIVLVHVWRARWLYEKQRALAILKASSAHIVSRPVHSLKQPAIQVRRELAESTKRHVF